MIQIVTKIRTALSKKVVFFFKTSLPSLELVRTSKKKKNKLKEDKNKVKEVKFEGPGSSAGLNAADTLDKKDNSASVLNLRTIVRPDSARISNLVEAGKSLRTECVLPSGTCCHI